MWGEMVSGLVTLCLRSVSVNRLVAASSVCHTRLVLTSGRNVIYSFIHRRTCTHFSQQTEGIWRLVRASQEQVFQEPNWYGLYTTAKLPSKAEVWIIVQIAQFPVCRELNTETTCYLSFSWRWTSSSDVRLLVWSVGTNRVRPRTYYLHLQGRRL